MTDDGRGGSRAEPYGRAIERVRALERALQFVPHGNVALCVADAAGKWAPFMDVTADFVYVRLHGSTHLYTSGYTGAELDTWAGHVMNWQRGGRDVYVYFDDDAKVRAPFGAMKLAARLGHARCATRGRSA